MPARLAEWLVTRAALLAVPYWLVNHGHRGQDRDLFQPEDEVRQVGDRAMAVLEVEGVEKLLSLLGAQLLDRLEHALARPRILRERIRLNLRWYADDRVDAPRRVVCLGRARGRSEAWGG